MIGILPSIPSYLPARRGPVRRQAGGTCHLDFKDISTGGGWVLSGCTASLDNDHIMTLLDPDVAKTANKITVNENTTTFSISYTFPSALDWSAVHFALRCYLHPGTWGASDSWYRLWTGGTLFYLQLWDSTLTRWRGWRIGASSWGSGWSILPFTAGDCYYKSADFDFTQCKKLTIGAVLGGSFPTGLGPAITPDGFWTLPKLVMPMVCVTFDDAKNPQKPLIQYANSLGIPVTLFAPTSYLGSGDNFTLADLAQFHRAGNLVANHSVTHSAAWNTSPDGGGMSEADRLAEILEAGRLLTDWGFGDGARIFASPAGVLYGIDNAEIWRYIDAWRGFSPYMGSPPFFGVRVSLASLNADKVKPTYDADVTAAIERCVVTEKADVVLTNHNFTSGTYMTPAEGKAMLDAIRAHVDAGHCTAGTLADLLDRQG